MEWIEQHLSDRDMSRMAFANGAAVRLRIKGGNLVAVKIVRLNFKSKHLPLCMPIQEVLEDTGITSSGAIITLVRIAGRSMLALTRMEYLFRLLTENLTCTILSQYRRGEAMILII